METAKMPTAIGSLLECGKCLEVYKDPRILPCGHTFCVTCIRSSRQDKCAVCKRKFAGVVIDELPRNYVVDNFISSLPSVKCSLCDGSETEAGAIEYICIDCWDPMCAACSDGHKRYSRQAKNHVIKPIADVSQSDVEQHNRKMTSQCAEHSGQDIAEVGTTFVGSIHSWIKEAQDAERLCNIQLDKLSSLTESLVTKRDNTLTDVKQFLSGSKHQLQKAFDKAMKRIDNVGEEVASIIEVKFAEEKSKLDKAEDLTKSMRRNAHEALEPLQKLLPPQSSAAEKAKFAKTSPKQQVSSNVVDVDIDEGVMSVSSISAWKTEFNSWLKPALSALQADMPVSKLTLTATTSKDSSPDAEQLVSTNGLAKPIRLAAQPCISVKHLISNNGTSVPYAYDISAANTSLFVYCPRVTSKPNHVWQYRNGTYASELACNYVIRSAACMPGGELVYVGREISSSGKDRDNSWSVPRYRLATIPAGTDVSLQYYPQYLHVSHDGIMYVSDNNGSVHVHTGKDWAETQCFSGLQIGQIIKIKNGSFVALYQPGPKLKMEIGMLDMMTGIKQKWPVPNKMNLGSCLLAYDNRETIFVLDKDSSTVHTWLIHGQYKGALLTQNDISEPCCMAVDTTPTAHTNSMKLYVGQCNGEVKVYDYEYAL